MKPRAIVLIQYLFALVVSHSCVRDVVLDAGGKPEVVVECILMNRDVQELHLNYTRGASKTEYAPVPEAVATLINLTRSEVVGQFEPRQGDLWTLDYTPSPYDLYRLEVEIPGYEIISAEDTMPGPIEVFYCFSSPGSTILNGAGIYYDYVMSDLRKKYLDKTGKLFYHRGAVYYLRDAARPFVVYAMNHNPVTNAFELADNICTDHPSVLSCNVTGGQYVPSPLSIEEPKKVLFPILEGAPLHRHYLIFPKDSDEEDTFFLISGNFTGDWWHTPGINTVNDPSSPDGGKPGGFLVFASMSDTYYRYITEAVHYHSLQESSDMTTIYLRDNIFSNIDGGIGLFATMFEEKLAWARYYTDLEKWEEYWNSDMYKYLDDLGRRQDEYGHWGYYVPDWPPIAKSYND